MKSPLIHVSESCALTFPDQMPKENEREPHVRGLFDLRILH